MNYAAEDLRKRGIAVWNIEYRGVDRPGGGYPGTFEDAAKAADALRGAAGKYSLALDNVVAVGHSAGGHLALWLAARLRLPASSPLAAKDQLSISTVVSLGGLPDLKMAHDTPNGCGPDPVEQLTGRPTASRPDIYSDISVDRLLPLGIQQMMVSGREDRIVPPRFGAAYAVQAAKAGDPVSETVIEDAGHFDMIAPGTGAWEQEVSLIRGGARLAALNPSPARRAREMLSATGSGRPARRSRTPPCVRSSPSARISGTRAARRSGSCASRRSRDPWS